MTAAVIENGSTTRYGEKMVVVVLVLGTGRWVACFGNSLPPDVGLKWEILKGTLDD